MPIYRTIDKIQVNNCDIEFDLTETVKMYAGPLYNYHQNITPFNIARIIEFNTMFMNLKDFNGKVTITDNFKKTHEFNYQDNIKWNECII